MGTVCGLDVHKDSIFMCILKENGEKIEQKFTTLTPDLNLMTELILKHAVEYVAMESTDIYWIPIWRLLDLAQIPTKLANPLFIKQVPGRKTDIKDAQWIATVLQKGLVMGSYVPDQAIQELRIYERRHADLRKKRVRVLQSIDRHLQRCNICLSNYTSTVESKSMEKVIESLIKGERDPKKLVSLIHGRTKNKHGDKTIEASLTGINITDGIVFALKQLTDELKQIDTQQLECLSEMTKISNASYSEEIVRLDSIPGIAKQSAMTIVAELGVDMKAFATAAALVGWLGLRPRNDESAGKIMCKKTLHGNKYLRLIIIQCAWAAIREKGSRFGKKYADLIKRGMNAQKALVAIARKLTVVIWNILSKKELYDPNRGNPAVIKNAAI